VSLIHHPLVVAPPASIALRLTSMHQRLAMKTATRKTIVATQFERFIFLPSHIFPRHRLASFTIVVHFYCHKPQG
jgi:hypothetical protein